MMEVAREIATSKIKKTIYMDLLNYVYTCIVDNKELDKTEWEKVWATSQGAKKADTAVDKKGQAVPSACNCQQFTDYVLVTDDIVSLVQKRNVPIYVKTVDLVAAISSHL